MKSSNHKYCSSCMEERGNYQNGMCRDCYEAMIQSITPKEKVMEELNQLIKELTE